jgi:hypothetical protein
MKLYIGSRGRDGSGLVEVVVDGGPRRPLKHRVRHSPTGLEWGYHGSGPADTARSILWDVLGSEPEPRLYQQFKADIIGGLDHDDWQLSEQAVRDWLGR